MKTKRVLMQVEVMTESVVKELNDMNEKIDNKANRSDVQTIAKHVQGLERDFNTVNMENAKSFRDLESRVANLEKEKCKCNTNTRKSMENVPANAILKYVVDMIKVNPNQFKSGLAEPQADYFLKAKNLLIEYAEKTMIKKGMEYTPVGDRFANFRPILGEKKTAIEKLIGYNAKHVQYCFMQESNMTAKTIDELLEHWGDVFNYNVLGLAMENTDRSKAFVVPYADRETQEKEIKDIVNGAKHFTEYNSKLSKDELYSQLLNHIKESNLNYIIFLFAKQLERLECK